MTLVFYLYYTLTSCSLAFELVSGGLPLQLPFAGGPHTAPYCGPATAEGQSRRIVPSWRLGPARPLHRDFQPKNARLYLIVPLDCI